MGSVFLRKVVAACFFCQAISAMLLCSTGEAATLKKIVAVTNFENKSNYSGQWQLDSGMADQLTDALMQTGQFVVVERQKLGDVMEEQDLAASGRAQKSKSAQTGKLTSAQVQVKGTITEFEEASEGGGGGVRVFGLGVGGKKQVAHVGLIIRLIDTTTGQVLDSQRVEGKAESGGFAISGGMGPVSFGTEEFHKTPLGKAVQETIDNAVALIASRMKNIPFQTRIIKATGSEVIIGAGQSTGVSVGDTFTVYSVGEELVDPDTGDLLGAEESKLGTVQVFEVKEKYSKARSVSGKGYEKGQIVRGN
jgi:curli biogenesis system outer membrane secretion channel CsgG